MDTFFMKRFFNGGEKHTMDKLVSQSIIELYDKYGAPMTSEIRIPIGDKLKFKPVEDITLAEFMKQDLNTTKDVAGTCIGNTCQKARKGSFFEGIFSTLRYAYGGKGDIAIPMSPRRVFRDGFCYLNVFVALSGYVFEEDSVVYADFLREVAIVLGAWPTCLELAKSMVWLTQRITYLAGRPIPNVCVNHDLNIAHCVDQRGPIEGTHIMTVASVRDFIVVALDTEFGSLAIGGTCLKMAYDELSEAIRISNRSYTPWITFNKMVCQNTLLATTLICSPATLDKIGKWFNDDEGFRRMVVSLETSVNDALLRVMVIKRAIKGVKIHFLPNDIERSTHKLHGDILAYIDNQDGECAKELAKSVRKHIELVKEKNMEFVYYEASVVALSDSQWRRMHNFSYLSIGESWCTELLTKAQKLSENTFIHQCRISNPAISRVLFELWSALVIMVQVGWGCLAVWFSIKTIMLWLFRWSARHYLGSQYGQHMWLLLITLVALIVSVSSWVRAGRSTLQATPNEKKVTGILAFIILIVHIFDVDVGMLLASSLHTINRTALLLTDETKNIMPKLIGTNLQAAFDEIEEVMELELEIDPEVSLHEKVRTNKLTFQQWIDQKVCGLEKYTRELQYGGGKIDFIVTTTNHTDVVQEMILTKQQWNSVVGGTGSGKSTRIPVYYYKSLQTTLDRSKRILICEPSRATTANVAGGISQFLGQQVYYKHRTREQVGLMGIQVMTYGSALMKAVSNPEFLTQFDAVFLDESHFISSHALTLESLLNQYENVRKFYVSATPRVGDVPKHAGGRFAIQERMVDNTDPNFWLKEQGSGSAYDVTNLGPVILCFVQGRKQADILAAKVNASDRIGFKGYSLHSDNFDTSYNQIINATNESQPCIIFCTNILETGVTLNADCVVDFGFTMRPVLSITEKRCNLQCSRVTRFERQQRIGRVGRVKDGVAICCGKTQMGRPPVPPDVVYEAALFSFLYDLDLYTNESLDTHYLATVTKKQAEVMLNFDLPMFLLRDLVDHDGCMQPEMITALKKNLVHDAQISTRDVRIAADKWGAWPRAHDLIMMCSRGNDDEELAKYGSHRIPFCAFQLMSIDVENFIKACGKYEPYRSFETVHLGGINKKVLLRIDPENVNMCYAVASALKSQQQDVLKSLVAMRDACQDNKLLCCFKQTKRMVADQQKRIEATKRNISKIQIHMSRLELYETFVREKETNEQFTHSDFRTVFDHLRLQIDGDGSKKNVCKALGLEECSQIGVGDLLVHHGDRIAAGLLLASGAIIVSQIYGMLRETKPKNLFSLEGKGKPYRNRDKRSEAIAVNEAFDVIERVRRDYKVKSSKTNEKPDFVSNLLGKKNPFVNFYDIADEDVEKAVFRTLAGKTLYETQTPVRDVVDLDLYADRTRGLDSPLHGMRWCDDEPIPDDHVVCDVTMRDGRKVQIDLTRHQANRVGAKGNTIGYSNHNSEFRQTGSTKLEIKGTVPMTKIQASCVDMVGLAYSDGKPVLNVVLYGDFIICPAHIMLLPNKLTLKFKHTSGTFEVRDFMCFQLCDLIIFKRPNFIAPIKVEAKCGQLVEPTQVQLAYRNPQNLAGVLSASDYCNPFDNGRWTYTISTKKGMCGAAVISVTTGQFVGIHVSANEVLQRNFMEPLSQSMINVLKKLEPFVPGGVWGFESESCGYMSGELDELQSSYDWDLSYSPGRYTIDRINESASAWGLIQNYHRVEPTSENVSFTLSGGFEIIGKSTSNLCTKHKIVGLSPYWEQFKQLCPQLVDGIDEFENAYAPSALNREAYYKDMGKFNRDLVCRCDLSRLNHARNMVIEDLRKAGMSQSRVMSHEEVLGDLELSTAAGALYSCKKKVIFDGWDDQKLIEFSKQCRQHLVDGTNVGVWNGSLKDELRPVEKVRDNKTRVFTAAPITTLVGGKAFVDDFNRKFYATHLNARHTVGINPWGGGWDRLAKFLGGSNMPLYMSGDGSRFDSSIDPILFDQVVKIRLAFATADMMKPLFNLYHEIIYTPILLENGHVVMKKVGNNSGQPSTVVDNTLVLMLCFYYAALSVSDDDDWIRKNFLFVCNGDDQKCAMTEEFVKKEVNFKQQLEECGLNYEFDEPTTDICRYPYMSLTLVPNPSGIYGFILHPTRIVAINQWMPKKGLLGVAQRAFAAMMHSYNDKWLFAIMHTYLYWLLVSFEGELKWAMSNSGETVSYMSPSLVKLAHYGGTQLQVDTPPGSPEKAQKEIVPSQQTTSEGPVAGTRSWVVPKLPPFEKSAGFRKIGGKHPISREGIKSVPKGIRTAMRNDVATDNQFLEWEKNVKEEYSLKSDGEWNTILMAWCVYCAHNGTSDKLHSTDVMPIPNGSGSTDDVQIGGFVKASQTVGLRKIMRKLSRETSQMLLELGEMTKWGLKRGIKDKFMIPYAFDFYVEDEYTPQDVRMQLAAAKHAALGMGQVDAVMLDNKHHDLQTVVRPRTAQGEAYKAPVV